MRRVIWQLFDSPLILVHIVRQRHLRIDIIPKQENVRLIPRAPIQSWEFKQSLLYGPIVVNMDSVLEHIVNKVGVRLHEIIERL